MNFMHSLLQRNSTLEYYHMVCGSSRARDALRGFFFLRTYARAVDDNLNFPQGILTYCALRKENVPAKDRYQKADYNRTQTLMRSLLKALYDTYSLVSYQIFKINYLFIKNIQCRLMFPLYNNKDVTTKLSRAPVSCGYQIPLFSLMF